MPATLWGLALSLPPGPLPGPAPAELLQEECRWVSRAGRGTADPPQLSYDFGSLVLTGARPRPPREDRN